MHKAEASVFLKYLLRWAILLQKISKELIPGNLHLHVKRTLKLNPVTLCKPHLPSQASLPILLRASPPVEKVDYFCPSIGPPRCLDHSSALLVLPLWRSGMPLRLYNLVVQHSAHVLNLLVTCNHRR